MSRNCVRVNPQRLLRGDKSASIVTVTLPPTHELFSTKCLVLMEPLSIPLREYKVGVEEMEDDARFEIDPTLPNVDSITYYANWAGDHLTAHQFEVLWQFQKFARGEKIDVIDKEARQQIMTLRHTAEPPLHAYDSLTRRHIYNNWSIKHLGHFLVEYSLYKGAVAAWSSPKTDDSWEEWLETLPPRILEEPEALALRTERETAAGLVVEGNNLLDTSLDDIIAKGLLTPKVRRTKNAGVAKMERVRPKGETRRNHTDSFHSRRIGQDKVNVGLRQPITRPGSVYGRKCEGRLGKRTFKEDRDNRKRRKSRTHHTLSSRPHFASEGTDMMKDAPEGEYTPQQ